MKKVCILTSGHSPFDDRIFYKEARSLCRAGYVVHIIASTGYIRDRKEGITIQGFSLDGKVPYKFAINWIVRRLVFIYLGVKAGADIYHVHEPKLLATAYFIRLIRRLFFLRKVQVVHEIRDFYLDEAFLDSHLGYRERVKLRLLAVWDRVLHRLCDYIIGVEQSKIERVVSYGISPTKIMVIENYAPLDSFHERRKSFDDQNFVLGYAGGLSFTRGINKLTEACVMFSKRVNIRPTLLLVGRFISKAKEEEEWLLNYCRENKEFVSLRLVGWVNHEEVPEILAAADVCFSLFYSKRYEKVLSTNGGPIKLYEYMALGKPIIATNAYALRHTIETAHCGVVVDPKDGAEAVAGAMEFYFKNPDRTISDGRNGRLAVERYFNWSIAEKKLLQVYAKLSAAIDEG